MEKTWVRSEDKNFRNSRKKKDFSGPDFYNDNWVGYKKNFKKEEIKIINKPDVFNIINNESELIDENFSWIKNCIL